MKRRGFLKSAAVAGACGGCADSSHEAARLGARLIFVGGFLGAGKTTLMASAARLLNRRGHRVGFITNDQAPGLVDTAFLQRYESSSVEEVAGSCFCCNFNGMLSAVQSLARKGADVILTEPVGSCADLSATILQPIKRLHPEFQLSPYSVLADPSLVTAALDAVSQGKPNLHADALYILSLQLAEADMILLNKCDALTDAQRKRAADVLRNSFPDIPLRFVSGQEGDGLEAWLDQVAGASSAGTRLVEVDYDRYANGEAVLGWINAVIDVSAKTSAPAFLRAFMASLDSLLAQAGAPVAHAKAMLNAADGAWVINQVYGRGAHLRDAGAALGETGRLTVNLRAQAEPAALEAMLHQALKSASGDDAASVRAIAALKPGRPVPTYRDAGLA